ncbi:MAG: hypothetical protein JWN14_2448 [Chthonomonadales bacterium]|nr:hypothetical protein [Chthonomonadales bacterium]
MKEGTIFLALVFPTPQPMFRVKFFDGQIEGCHVDMFMWPDGHLEVNISSHTEKDLHHETQPIRVLGTGRLRMFVLWQNFSVNVEIERIALLSFQSSQDTVVFETNDLGGSNLSAIGHPDELRNCENWIRWRQTHLSLPKAARANRRLKTDAEQMQELEDELASLKDDINAVRQGKRNRLSKIAASLRGLLYWEMRIKRGQEVMSTTYNPLLLRMAARMELPLPLFAISESAYGYAAILDTATLQIRANRPSLQHVDSRQELMDLQEWLNVPMRGRTQPTVHNLITAKSLIHDVANTLGGAHFDEDVDTTLDMLRDLLPFESGDFLASFLTLTADVVVHLGDFVITRWREGQAQNPDPLSETL